MSGAIWIITIHSYAAINPKEGKLLACLMPSMEKNCFQAFLNELASEVNSPISLVVDRAGSHKGHLQVPTNVQLVFLPPRSPELNPVERFFQELRKGLANQVFDSLPAIETKIEQLLQPYFDHPQCLIQLTHYPWMNPAN